MATIGLALGGGVARGWSHIGVLRVLIEAGHEPDIVAGTSIGAVVGGLYLAGKLDALEAWARALTLRSVRGLIDISLSSGGLIGGKKLRDTLNAYAGDIAIENLTRNFAAIATDLKSGHEVWLRQGSLTRALRASYALPGAFPPVNIDGRLHVDGALTNPVPTSAARAMGARVVIGVTLHKDANGNGHNVNGHAPDPPEDDRNWTQWLNPERLIFRLIFGEREGVPGIANTMTSALNILMDRLTRVRLAADPADVLIEPEVSHIGLLQFERAAELIALGEAAARKALPEIERALQND